MSAHRIVTLTCNRCGEVFDDGTSVTEKEARRSARSERWSSGDSWDDYDECPKHHGYHWADGMGWQVDEPSSASNRERDYQAKDRVLADLKTVTSLIGKGKS